MNRFTDTDIIFLYLFTIVKYNTFPSGIPVIPQSPLRLLTVFVHDLRVFCNTRYHDHTAIF